MWIGFVLWTAWELILYTSLKIKLSQVVELESSELKDRKILHGDPLKHLNSNLIKFLMIMKIPNEQIPALLINKSNVDENILFFTKQNILQHFATISHKFEDKANFKGASANEINYFRKFLQALTIFYPQKNKEIEMVMKQISIIFPKLYTFIDKNIDTNVTQQIGEPNYIEIINDKQKNYQRQFIYFIDNLSEQANVSYKSREEYIQNKAILFNAFTITQINDWKTVWSWPVIKNYTPQYAFNLFNYAMKLHKFYLDGEINKNDGYFSKESLENWKSEYNFVITQKISKINNVLNDDITNASYYQWNLLGQDYKN